MKCCNSKSRVRNIHTVDKPNSIYDFDFFFKLFSVSFIFFGIYRKHPRTQKVLRIIEIIFDIIIFYCLLIPLRVSLKYNPSAMNSFSTLAPVLFVLLIRISFLKKRDEILSVAEEISKNYLIISEEMHENTSNTKKWIVLPYIFCIFFAIFITIVEACHNYADNQGMLYISVIATDLNKLSVDNKVFRQLLGLCLTFSSCMAFMTYLLSLLFCCIFYKFLQKLFIVFGQKLSEHQKLLGDMKDGISFTNRSHESLDINKSLFSNLGREICDLLVKKTNQFNNLKSLATKIDNITSVVAASLFALAIASLFEAQNFSILANGIFQSNKTFIVLETGILFLAFLVVICLSFCASNVTSAFEEVVQIIRSFSSNLCEITHPSKTNQLVLMLMFLNNSNTTEIHMTGWGMFNINKNLVLTIAGVLVTYGVMINQMMTNQMTNQMNQSE